MEWDGNPSPAWLDDYARIEQAIRFLEQNYLDQPDLKAAAQSVGLSEYHFQRLFTRWVGISPKRFLQYLTKEHAKGLLRQRTGLLETTYASGLSSPGRLHDLFVACEAVTPGEYKSGGSGLTLRYGFHPTPFGECLLAVSQRGVCWFSFVADERRAALGELRATWRQAALVEDAAATAPAARSVFFPTPQPERPLALLLNGTNFQIKVWEALLRIPAGSVVTYEDIAVAIGLPGASRAVGQAVGRNHIAVLIPCHRVIRKDGDLGSYRYGSARKKALLGWEFARRDNLALAGAPPRQPAPDWQI
ncbi:MAG: methylated-DNA--[protein]-cysteine S-methyltransferase [Bellilinea sp.]|jgi:AraC family transcriptional regulator of adaptative response/methylated-DNA-[protein]-cysteine methyltransferase